MHGIFCVLSAISVCDNYQNFITELSISTIARLASRWTRNLKVVIGKGSKLLRRYIYYNLFQYFSFMLKSVSKVL